LKKNSPTHRSKALDIFYRVLSNCSLKCLFKIAKIIAFIAFHTKNQLSSQTTKNIKLCFPELSNSEQRNLIFESLHHTCCAFIELASLWNLPIDTVLTEIKIKNIDKHFFNSDKVNIVIAPHHGSWEMLNLWLASSGISYSLYKPARSNGVDQYVLQKRSRNNAILVPANTSGLRQLLQGLKKTKASCMILPDQRPATRTAQVDAPFYNFPAPTSLLIKRLSSKLDCDIYIASATRDLDTASYQLSIKLLEHSEFLKDDLQSATYLNESIQNIIKEQKSQYQWAYRRFNKEVYKNNLP